MKPDRIVSLLSSATEILCALGLGDNLVAVSHECDWPPEVQHKPRVTWSAINSSRSSGEIDEEVKRLLMRGEPLYGIHGDLIASLRPELIVTQAQCDVCAVRLEDVQTLLASRPELAATRLVSLQPNRLDEIMADILRVGDATGRREIAERFVDSLHARMELVRQRAVAHVQSAGRPRRVAIVEWTAPLMLAANWTPELVEIAGGCCPLVKYGEHSRYHDWAEIREFDPEVIVVAPCGFDLERATHEMNSLEQLPGWSDTAAARSARIFPLNGSAYLNRSGPRIVDTLEILCDLFWGDIKNKIA